MIKLRQIFELSNPADEEDQEEIICTVYKKRCRCRSCFGVRQAKDNAVQRRKGLKWLAKQNNAKYIKPKNV